MKRDIATYMLELMIEAHRDEIALYTEMLLRWLQAKREYPWNNEPEPQAANIFIPFLYRDAIIREFQRAA